MKAAHESKDLSGIDTAMESLNAAWQNASQEMYSSTQGDPMAGATGGAAENPNASSQNADSVTDVDYEEVSGESKK